MAKLFDTHAHYTDERLFGNDLLLNELFSADISHILTVATCMEDGAECARLARRYDGIYASAGIHPHECGKSGNLDDAMTVIENQLTQEKVVALGEIGLDYYYDFSDRETQMRFFRAQMELAEKTGKPVIIHDREAHGDTMDMVREFRGRVIGVLHSCSASAEQVKNASKTLDSVLATPPERLLLETDCPYLAPVPMRGKTNHSGYLHFTAEKAASLLGMDYDALCALEVENAKKLFGIQ